MASRRKPLAKRSPVYIPLRLALVGAWAGWFARKWFMPILLPFGPAQRLTEVPTFGPVDETNDLLMAKHGKLTKIYERIEPGRSPLMVGTETVFFDDHGTMYATTEHANLISMTNIQTDSEGKATVETHVVKDLGAGRPLAGKFLGNTLYVADAVLGLTRVQNVYDPRSKVEIVASTVVDDEDNDGQETRINFADDIAVAPRSGMVYFTDASEIHPEQTKDRTWDVMYASKVEILRGPTGRLIQYDPSTDKMAVLARGLYFANGIAVAEDESYLVFVETFYSRVTKYHLTGEKRGTMEYIINGYPSPAWFDGIDCAWKRFGAQEQSSFCYAIGVSKIIPVAKVVFKLPGILQIIFRTVLMMVPKKLVPEVKPFASITILDAETLSQVGFLQDPHGTDIKTMTGITFHENRLYLGSLRNDYIAVYNLA